VFQRVLIANRGEIACRVIHTCRRLGIGSVAVYSEADRDSLHVELADAALCIGPPRAADSYLDIESVVDAARKSGAEAVHPGYGFLSENADFAKACADAGITFIGPHPEAIRLMGSKTEARRLAREHGVPVVPGYDGDDQSDEVLENAARQIGFPVMIKASAGGGGRGIRVVEDEAKFAKSAEQARREAEGAFGDGRLIIERYVREPRHVEVQIAGDKHGNVVHLFERECSIQRRHQKVIEEAPAQHLADATRSTLYAAATEMARAVGYDSAGTVEFVLDAENEDVFFLEMNTRLQVEHPVTEMITGFDLVEMQLRAAAGEPLGIDQDDISASGAAIEVRVNAEDPAKKFLPRTGRIERLEWPALPGVRIEAGVKSGSVITPHYDSLIAKVIGFGPSRDEAIERLIAGLDATVLFGPDNNLGFLREVIDSDAFRSGVTTTQFLPRHFPKGPLPFLEPGLPDAAVAALAIGEDDVRAAADTSPWQHLGPWRLLERAGHTASCDVFLEEGKRRFAVRLLGREGVDFGDGPVAARLRQRDGNGFELDVEGRIERVAIARHGDRLLLVRSGRRRSFAVLRREEVWKTEGATNGATAGAVAAPFPGQVAEVLVKAGDRVSEGDVVVVIEAMKMLHNLAAGGAGVVSDVRCSPGTPVVAGEVLVAFES